MASLLTKLSRLGNAGPAAPVSAAALPPCQARGVVLDDLRAKMQAVLARAAKREPRPVARLDAPELPFTTRETDLGPLHERALHLSSAHRMGRVPVYPARHARPEILALLALDPALLGCDPARALFLDTETTGLAGGAGTVAFLVGVATWQDGPAGAPVLVMEQYLVRNLGEEAPMLARVSERIRQASMLVTFNGKSFDMPLLRARFVMARMAAPPEPPHLDLVHVARRIHRAKNCKLTSLERDLLGFERIDDVPSGDVSACYMHFLRTGDTRALLGVIDHNAWDVVAMAALMGLYGEPLDQTQLPADDLAGVARTLKRAGRVDEAFGMATRAVDGGGGDQALRARAEIAKARGDRARALADFETLLQSVDCGDGSHLKVRLELAKLYEHHAKDFRRARDIVDAGTSEDPAKSERRARRLAVKLEKQQKKGVA